MSVLAEGVEGGFAEWSAGAQMPARRGEVLLAKNRDMELRWERDGYFIEGDEGPVAILYEPAASPSMTMLAIDDPYCRGGSFLYEPYEVTLLGRGMSLVTLVTPQDSSLFETEVVAEFAADDLLGS
ncbi:hypothetical protein [Micromonospora sp. NPDC050200]|uniref:hypothetical protein n=1 Tax=Micromonospora sp. NPDC050200 TaxID=3155664 RepID=UPI0033D07DF5